MVLLATYKKLNFGPERIKLKFLYLGKKHLQTSNQTIVKRNHHTPFNPDTATPH